MMRTILCLFLLSSFVTTVSFAQETEFQKTYEQGKAVLAKKDYGQAIQHFTKASEIEPKNPEAYLKLIEAAIGKKDLAVYKRALTGLETIKYTKLDAAVYLAYGNIAKKQKQYKNSLDVIDKGMQSFPENVDLLIMSASIYKKLNNNDEAIRKLSKAKGLSPNNVVVLADLGELYLQENKNRSQELFEQVVKLDPNHDLALSALGMLYLRKYNIETTNNDALKKAVSYYERYAKRHPNDNNVTKILENLYVLMEK
ncbi:MAG: tetratricopeptide repeat protein [Aureispira sp.]|nr:tetratricopeptide repeat protein [Aureispira sp.]